MQAILTRYLGPTDHRGSRVKAECERGSITLEWDDALNEEENARAAVSALCKKFGWVPPLYTVPILGGMPSRSKHAYVAVFPPRS